MWLRQYIATSRAAAAFDARTSEGRLAGMTADRLIAILGPPYYDGRIERGPGPGHHDPLDHFVLVFQDVSGEMCRVEFSGAQVSRVEHFRE
jgi:hypothetical protein